MSMMQGPPQGMPQGPPTQQPGSPMPGIDPSAPGAGLLQQALSGLNPQQQQVVMAVLSDPMVMETILTLAAAGSVMAQQQSPGAGQGMPPGGPPQGDPNAMFGPPR